LAEENPQVIPPACAADSLSLCVQASVPWSGIPGCRAPKCFPGGICEGKRYHTSCLLVSTSRWGNL